MKKALFILIASFFMTNAIAQDITGDWYGKIIMGLGAELPITFHITKDGENYKGTRDSPKQNKFNIPIVEVTLKNNDIFLELKKDEAVYKGTVKNDTLITGLLTQNGRSIPILFTRTPIKERVLIRKQEPIKPYPYKTEEVRFLNEGENFELAGTLTLPRKKLNAKEKNKLTPAVILVSGSGANDRNEEVAGHKPFLVLADHLTRNGIAVLRYDDRGTGSSSGSYANATTLDLATDAEAAINYLLSRKDIDPNNIGILGHSEGGIIAPIVASQNRNVGFIGLLAGPGLRGKELLMEQGYLIDKSNGYSEEKALKVKNLKSDLFNIVIANIPTPEHIESKARVFLNTTLNRDPSILPLSVTKEAYIKLFMDSINNKWMQHFIALDPSQYLKNVSCPVLAINGSRDLQVPSKINLDAIADILKNGGNNDVTTIEIPNLNHLFQHTKTGKTSEYGTIEETFAPEALEIISDWIKEKN